MFSRRTSALPYSLYLESCCQELSRARGHRTDLYLVEMVRLQHFVERIGQSVVSDDINPILNVEAPIAFQYSSIRRELSMWKRSLPPDLEQHSE